jgi:ABC-2 type transport system permease protein
MKNSWIIAKREIAERLNSKSFLMFLFIGPILVLLALVLLFKAGDEGKSQLKILVSDEGNLLEGILHTQKNSPIQYQISRDYVSFETFRSKPEYQQYDALLDVNHKVLENKMCMVFYRDKPAVERQIGIRFQLEKRIEEILVNETSKMSISDYRKIKQPLNVVYRNVYDPKQEIDHLAGWSGFGFGLLTMIFIFLFGMTILRSTSRDKSNRIVEVILASVKSFHFMVGKIVGIGVVAFLQFLVWTLFVVIGLYFFRENLFPDIYDPANLGLNGMGSQDALVAEGMHLNKIVELVYDRINYSVMIPIFLVFFTVGYFFYAAFFASIGASSGSESDGQQFILPLIGLFGLSIYAGYLAVQFPESDLVTYLFYLPFTSPMVALVKVSQGFSAGQSYTLFMSLMILLISTIIAVQLASRIYKNGILQFGHRLSFKHFWKWMKKI